MLMMLVLLSGCFPATVQTPHLTVETLASLPTSAVTVTPTALATSSPTLLPSTTPTMRPTPLPTVPSEDAEALIIKLSETNGDCQLPCWWGWIVPGKTKWQDVHQFLRTFAMKIRLNRDRDGLQYWSAHFTVPKTIEPSEELIASIDVRAGVIEQLLIGQPYVLTDLLEENGKPNDVLLEISDDTFEAFSPWGVFEIALFWQDKGILAVYEGRIEKTEPLHLCMNKIDKTATSFWLWDPARKRTMEEVGGQSLFGTPPFLPEFHSLQEVIGIDIETFHQTYSNPNAFHTCFRILDSFSP